MQLLTVFIAVEITELDAVLSSLTGLLVLIRSWKLHIQMDLETYSM